MCMGAGTAVSRQYLHIGKERVNGTCEEWGLLPQECSVSLQAGLDFTCGPSQTERNTEPMAKTRKMALAFLAWPMPLEGEIDIFSAVAEYPVLLCLWSVVASRCVCSGRD